MCARSFIHLSQVLDLIKQMTSAWLPDDWLPAGAQRNPFQLTAYMDALLDSRDCKASRMVPRWKYWRPNVQRCLRLEQQPGVRADEPSNVKKHLPQQLKDVEQHL